MSLLANNQPVVLLPQDIEWRGHTLAVQEALQTSRKSWVGFMGRVQKTICDTYSSDQEKHPVIMVVIQPEVPRPDTHKSSRCALWTFLWPLKCVQPMTEEEYKQWLISQELQR